MLAGEALVDAHDLGVDSGVVEVLLGLLLAEPMGGGLRLVGEVVVEGEGHVRGVARLLLFLRVLHLLVGLEHFLQGVGPVHFLEQFLLVLLVAQLLDVVCGDYLLFHF